MLNLAFTYILAQSFLLYCQLINAYILAFWFFYIEGVCSNNLVCHITHITFYLNLFSVNMSVPEGQETYLIYSYSPCPQPTAWQNRCSKIVESSIWNYIALNETTWAYLSGAARTEKNEAKFCQFKNKMIKFTKVRFCVPGVLVHMKEIYKKLIYK